MSNYPSNYPGGYGGGFGSAYPPSSGPPPPPGGYGGGYGGYGGGGYGAYGGYQMGSAPPPGGQHGYTGGYGGGYGGVPGFTMPSQQALQQTQYAFQGQQAPNMNQCPSQQYNSFAQMMEQQQLQAQKQMMQMMEHQREMMKQMTQQSQGQWGNSQEEAEEDPESVKEAMKMEMKRMYLDEVCRCLEHNGTLEMTHGTVHYYAKYEKGDPVAAYIEKEDGGDSSIVGKNWDAEHDCRFINEAVKGFGTDEDALTYIFSTRNNAQRQKLKLEFKTCYGKDLCREMTKELSGDYRDLVQSLLVPPAEFDAWSIAEAIYGLGTDDKVLIEIMMTRTNQQIQEIRRVYPDVASPKRKTKATLIEDDIRNDTSGDFKRLLISASQGNRKNIPREKLEEACEEVVNSEGVGMGMYRINQKKLVDVDKAQREAQKLFEAGEERWGTDEETFIRIFANRDFYQLRETYDNYVKISQRDILNSIDRETSGNFRKGLRALVQSIKCRPMFFAQRLKDSMKGLGTDEKTLTRIIVSRSEIDMQEIKACFLKLTEKTLYRYIKEDTSFNYKKLLLALVKDDVEMTRVVEN